MINIGTTITGIKKGIAPPLLVDATQNLIPGQGDVIRRPRGLNIPLTTGPGTLWLVFKAKQLISQTVNALGAINVNDMPTTTFMFLAPDSIMENIGHTWSEYESIYTRASQTLAKIGQLKSEASVLGKAASSVLNAKSAKQVLSAGGGASIAQNRVDSPLTYQGSERRVYDFEIQLVDEGNPKGDVLDPIHLLEKYSCPTIGDGISSIGLPYVFEVTSFPSNLINIKYAALESVQPTYMSPYRYGYPTKATVALRFKELSPLYRKTFDDTKGVISTSFSGLRDKAEEYVPVSKYNNIAKKRVANIVSTSKSSIKSYL